MRVVMTGATAGIGLEAAKRLISKKVVALTIGARTPGQVPRALDKAERLPLDLADLNSVRAFAEVVAKGPAIDVLLLNAGLQVIKPSLSAQGYELGFAVNHLSHYLLARLLLPAMAPNSRILFTSSGTHDPAEGTSIPAPRHADARRLAYPETDPQRDADIGTAGRRAYAASKLCNIMTARELALRIASDRPDIAVVGFDPGFTPGTGLARDYPGPIQLVFKFILPLGRPFMGERVSTPANSGRLMAAFALEPGYADKRGAYLSVRRSQLKDIPPSELARDAAACARLWDDSAALVGLQP